ncbi:hypothetical protein GCM10007205_22540 [Oxalicibacterium flavum]|uniref:Response regulatory domain-containing protein n=1 Tax=Oxalicibacterium flavum TaxID=179467 RepID=A0A8J2XYL1_9BURK|nr:response regulator [Oxalicibacterium flavum]GGC13139.1 hypothetical protein GCM10007205_22540 [Oxalicibacterium flavum]
MKTVLIVDDERDAVDVLSLMLEMNSFEVMVAYDGAQATGMIETRRPDLILSDFMMPELDGAALCERMKSDPDTAHIPFILMTAAIKPLDEIPADSVIKKPVELGVLLDTFAYFLQRGGTARYA